MWWVRVTVLQEMGRWAQMEIWVWRTFCCTPEAWECTGCFQKLNPTSTDRPRSRTRQHKKGGGRQKEGKKAGKVAAIVHTGGKDIRSGERKGRREGGKREGADEAGKTSKKLYSSFYLGVYLGDGDISGQVLEPDRTSFHTITHRGRTLSFPVKHTTTGSLYKSVPARVTQRT